MVSVLHGLAAHPTVRALVAAARWPWPHGWRPLDRLLDAGIGGGAFILGFLGLLAIGDLFAGAGIVSVFFPIAGLCFVFGYLLGPVYLPIPILLLPLLEFWTQVPLLESSLHLARQLALYGGAGVLLRRHLEKRPGSSCTYRTGCLLLAAVLAVSANLLLALVIYLQLGTVAPNAVWVAAVTFFLGDFGGFILVVPPVVCLAGRLLERRRLEANRDVLDRGARLMIAGLVALVCLFVVGGVLGLDDTAGMPASLTPALLPILAGAVLFGYGVGVGLFTFAGILLLSVSWLLTDPANITALQTVLIVCGAATLMVGAATSDRARVISQLDAAVAERTRQLDARNAVLSRVNAQLKSAADTDHLTALPNRRAFELALGGRLASGAAGVGLLIIDIDRFKRINDRLGHGVGDRALVHVARLLGGGVRGGDLLARIGGEEFAVICRTGDAAQLHEMAERLRRAVRDRPLPVEGQVRPLAITVSIGAAVAVPGDDVESLLRSADRALYAAKHAGRDCTRPAPPPDAAATGEVMA